MDRFLDEGGLDALLAGEPLVVATRDTRDDPPVKFSVPGSDDDYKRQHVTLYREEGSRVSQHHELVGYIETELVDGFDESDEVLRMPFPDDRELLGLIVGYVQSRYATDLRG